MSLSLDPFEDVLDDFRQGKPIVLADASDRENEGDIVVPAENCSAEDINFMLQHGKGLICLSMAKPLVDNLHLPMQVSENRAVFGTNFTQSMDFKGVASSGVTASARAKTIREAVKPGARAEDFVRPGFVFPLEAVPGGVFRRSGQTEGSVDLARLAGLRSAAVICEIMDKDGKMVRDEALVAFCKLHNLKLTDVAAVADYRLRNEVCLRRIESISLGQKDLDKLFVGGELRLSKNKELRVLVYQDEIEGVEQLVFAYGELKEDCLVRVHSECLTGDIFGSARCDCGSQFKGAFDSIINEGCGLLIYLQQEGRGIGLGNKLRAYALQDQGLDTVDANVRLGFKPDLRNYRAAAQILSDLGLRKIRLITNNPDKLAELADFGIEVSERVFIPGLVDKHNQLYLNTKREKMGHLLPDL